jgi:acyl carrier protein
VALKRRYGIQLSPNSQETRKYFASVRALAELLSLHRQGSAA